MMMNIDWQLGANIATIAGSIIGVAGILIVAYQLWRQKRINDAEFFLKLFAEFRAYEKLFEKMDSWSETHETFGNYKKHKGMIVSYLGFLETLYHLEKKGVLKMRQIDESFAYCFFKFVNIKTVQENDLFPCKYYFKNIYRFYQKWSKYRIDRNLPIEGLEFALDKTDAYKEIINDYT